MMSRYVNMVKGKKESRAENCKKLLEIETFTNIEIHMYVGKFEQFRNSQKSS